MDLRIKGLDPPILSAELLTVGLQKDHRGSAIDYVRAVVRLSETLPTVWTTDYHGTAKKSASNRFRQFLRKGSQGGAAEFWTNITALLKVMPRDVLLPHQLDEPPGRTSDNNEAPSQTVLEALREGVTQKDELRTSSTSAWNAYLSACDIAISTGEKFASPQFVRSSIFPLIHQYVRPSPGSSQWTVAGLQQQDVCVRACKIAIRQSPEVSEEEWLLISSKIVEDVQISSPEQSKDHSRSQDLVSTEAVRWYHLQAVLVNDSAVTSMIPTIKRVAAQEIVAAISVLTARNGKPYGSATILQTALELIPNIVLSDAQAKTALIAFSNQQIPRLITSPSAPHLIRLLDLTGSLVDAVKVYTDCMQAVERCSESPAKHVALKNLLSSPGLANAGLLSSTTNNILSRVIDQAVAEDDEQSWSLLMAAMGNASVPKSITEDVLTRLVDGLSIEHIGRANLHGLELIAKQDKASIRNFAVQPKGSQLMSKLLFIRRCF